MALAGMLMGLPAFADEPATTCTPPDCPPPLPASPQPLPASPQPEAQPQWQRRPSDEDAIKYGLKVEAGGTHRRLFQTYFQGLDAQLAMGGEGRDGGLSFGFGFIAGRTELGLSTFVLQTGGGGELIYGRFRVGGGFQFSLLSIHPVSRPSSSSMALGAGLNLAASVDVVTFDRHALYLAAKLHGDYFGKEPGDHNRQEVFTWGPSLLVGFRY